MIVHDVFRLNLFQFIGYCTSVDSRGKDAPSMAPLPLALEVAAYNLQS